ncbi:MAG: hypothetical protein GX128_01705 [Bacteroidales bacterium]|jgi:hypothetical protein|nr:hypothetical protein [Bacteroidales bacterium]
MEKSRLNLRNVVAIVTCLALMTVFVSCEKEDGKSEKSIIGKWVTSDYNLVHNDTIYFTENMRVEGYFIFAHTTLYPASSYYYTYSLTGNVIQITSYQPESTEFSESFAYLLNSKSLTIKGFSNPFSITAEARTDVHFTKIE